jgi:hypothetical protein
MVPSWMSICASQERTLSQPGRSPPPAQLEFTMARETEFVICDYTIDESFKDLKSLLNLLILVPILDREGRGDRSGDSTWGYSSCSSRSSAGREVVRQLIVLVWGDVRSYV